MRAPGFWKDKTLLSAALLPASAIYGGIARLRRACMKTERVPVRVICIGNLIAGGAGKTPVALALGAIMKKQGKNAHYLSRGYKSRNRGVTLVDRAAHNAQDVGDEPLLLSEVLPTWVAVDRVAGAMAAMKAGANMVIMDDGFQNPRLHKDVSFLVIDGHYGFGNERLLPSGPLREPVREAMKRVNAIIMIDDDKYGILRYVPQDIPVIRAQIRPVSSADFLKEKQIVAFCGIARPRKFYRTLQNMGCAIRKHISYPDHHVFTPGDIQFLREKAKEFDSMLVTTEKDYVRLPEDMRAEVKVLPVEVVFADEDALLKILLS